MNQKLQGKAASVRTRAGILYSLKQEGPSDSQTLASRLRISAMAVRQHLYALHSEKLVTYEEEPRPFGRPAKVWRLMLAADRFFSDGHAELAVDLLDSVRSLFGNDGLNRLFSERAKRLGGAFKKHIPKRGSLRERLEAMAGILNSQGFLAEVETLDDDALLLVENHCPIRAAATAYGGCCSSEQEIFERLFGPEIKVERIEHLLKGTRRCAYRVSAPRSKA